MTVIWSLSVSRSNSQMDSEGQESFEGFTDIARHIYDSLKSVIDSQEDTLLSLVHFPKMNQSPKKSIWSPSYHIRSRLKFSFRVYCYRVRNSCIILYSLGRNFYSLLYHSYREVITVIRTILSISNNLTNSLIKLYDGM